MFYAKIYDNTPGWRERTYCGPFDTKVQAKGWCFAFNARQGPASNWSAWVIERDKDPDDADFGWYEKDRFAKENA